VAPEPMAPSTDGRPTEVLPPVAAEPTRGGVTPAAGRGRLTVVACWAVFALACAATAGWAAVVVLCADRGLDITDEGFYLLSYRWWDTALRTFTGAQFIYGPVFELLAWDIRALRLARLAGILVTHLVFGLSLMRWLRLRRPSAPPTFGWELAGTAVVAASGAMLYSWLPLSPGYDDVSGLGSLLVMAGALAMAADVERDRRVRLWVPFAIGPAMAALLLAKWASSAATLLMVAGVVVVVLWSRGPGQIVRVLLAAIAGTLVTIVAVQLFLVSLTTAAPQMLAANRSVAKATNNPVTLLQLYARVDGSLLVRVVVAHAGLVLAVALAGLARGRALRLVAGFLGAVCLAWSVRHLVQLGALTGGTTNLAAFREPMMLLVVCAVVLLLTVTVRDRWARAADHPVADRRAGHRDLVLVGALLALPLTQALGTGNGLLPIAVCAFGAWAAVVVVAATRADRAGWPAQGLSAVLVLAAIAVPTSLGSTGVWSNPYRTAPHDQATASLRTVPALASLTVSPQEAGRLEGVRRRLAAYVDPPGRYMMGYDEMAGIVLALGGRPVGEAWYSATDHRRTAQAIAAQCPRGAGPWGARPPLVLTVRTIQPVDRRGLLACNVDLAKDYRLLSLQDVYPHLFVYVPLREASAAGDGQ
jgi:hypothetical protein